MLATLQYELETLRFTHNPMQWGLVLRRTAAAGALIEHIHRRKYVWLWRRFPTWIDHALGPAWKITHSSAGCIFREKQAIRWRRQVVTKERVRVRNLLLIRQKQPESVCSWIMGRKVQLGVLASSAIFKVQQIERREHRHTKRYSRPGKYISELAEHYHSTMFWITLLIQLI